MSSDERPNDLKTSVKRTERDSPARRVSAGVPRWVKLLGIIAIVLVLVFVLLHLSGHGMKHMHGTDMQSMDGKEHA